MNSDALRELCHAHGFSLELHAIPDGRYFAILTPGATEAVDLISRKAEIDLLRDKLMELCPAIEYVTVQIAAD